MRFKLLFLMVIVSVFNCEAQFWNGLMQGFVQGLQQFSNNQQQVQRQVDKAEPIEEEWHHEANGFKWIEIEQWNDKDGHFYRGVKDAKGKTIIPLTRKYRFVYFVEDKDYIGYFEVKNKDGKYGACDIFGTICVPCKYDGICLRDKRFVKKENGELKEMAVYLDRNGKSHKPSSDPNNWGPAWSMSLWMGGLSDGALPIIYDNSIVNGNSYVNTNNQSSQDILNTTVGENCLSCKGTGKCNACNGTKVANSMGNTYKCNVCDVNGNCPVCHGSGKASWNR